MWDLNINWNIRFQWMVFVILFKHISCLFGFAREEPNISLYWDNTKNGWESQAVKILLDGIIYCKSLWNNNLEFDFDTAQNGNEPLFDEWNDSLDGTISPKGDDQILWKPFSHFSTKQRISRKFCNSHVAYNFRHVFHSILWDV